MDDSDSEDESVLIKESLRKLKKQAFTSSQSQSLFSQSQTGKHALSLQRGSKRADGPADRSGLKKNKDKTHGLPESPVPSNVGSKASKMSSQSKPASWLHKGREHEGSLHSAKRAEESQALQRQLDLLSSPDVPVMFSLSTVRDSQRPGYSGEKKVALEAGQDDQDETLVVAETSGVETISETDCGSAEETATEAKRRDTTKGSTALFPKSVSSTSDQSPLPKPKSKHKVLGTKLITDSETSRYGIKTMWQTETLSSDEDDDYGESDSSDELTQPLDSRPASTKTSVTATNKHSAPSPMFADRTDTEEVESTLPVVEFSAKRRQQSQAPSSATGAAFKINTDSGTTLRASGTIHLAGQSGKRTLSRKASSSDADIESVGSESDEEGCRRFKSQTKLCSDNTVKQTDPPKAELQSSLVNPTSYARTEDNFFKRTCPLKTEAQSSSNVRRADNFFKRTSPPIVETQSPAPNPLSHRKAVDNFLDLPSHVTSSDDHKKTYPPIAESSIPSQSLFAVASSETKGGVFNEDATLNYEDSTMEYSQNSPSILEQDTQLMQENRSSKNDGLNFVQISNIKSLDPGTFWKSTEALNETETGNICEFSTHSGAAGLGSKPRQISVDSDNTQPYEPSDIENSQVPPSLHSVPSIPSLLGRQTSGQSLPPPLLSKISSDLVPESLSSSTTESAMWPALSPSVLGNVKKEREAVGDNLLMKVTVPCSSEVEDSPIYGIKTESGLSVTVALPVNGDNSSSLQGIKRERNPTDESLTISVSVPGNSEGQTLLQQLKREVEEPDENTSSSVSAKEVGDYALESRHRRSVESPHSLEDYAESDGSQCLFDDLPVAAGGEDEAHAEAQELQAEETEQLEVYMSDAEEDFHEEASNGADMKLHQQPSEQHQTIHSAEPPLPSTSHQITDDHYPNFFQVENTTFSTVCSAESRSSDNNSVARSPTKSEIVPDIVGYTLEDDLVMVFDSDEEEMFSSFTQVEVKAEVSSDDEDEDLWSDEISDKQLLEVASDEGSDADNSLRNYGDGDRKVPSDEVSDIYMDSGDDEDLVAAVDQDDESQGELQKIPSIFSQPTLVDEDVSGIDDEVDDIYMMDTQVDDDISRCDDANSQNGDTDSKALTSGQCKSSDMKETDDFDDDMDDALYLAATQVDMEVETPASSPKRMDSFHATDQQTSSSKDKDVQYESSTGLARQTSQKSVQDKHPVKAKQTARKSTKNKDGNVEQAAAQKKGIFDAICQKPEFLQRMDAISSNRGNTTPSDSLHVLDTVDLTMDDDDDMTDPLEKDDKSQIQIMPKTTASEPAESIDSDAETSREMVGKIADSSIFDAPTLEDERFLDLESDSDTDGETSKEHRLISENENKVFFDAQTFVDDAAGLDSKEDDDDDDDIYFMATQKDYDPYLAATQIDPEVFSESVPVSVMSVSDEDVASGDGSEENAVRPETKTSTVEVASAKSASTEKEADFDSDFDTSDDGVEIEKGRHLASSADRVTGETTSSEHTHTQNKRSFVKIASEQARKKDKSFESARETMTKIKEKKVVSSAIEIMPLPESRRRGKRIGLKQKLCYPEDPVPVPQKKPKLQRSLSSPDSDNLTDTSSIKQKVPVRSTSTDDSSQRPSTSSDSGWLSKKPDPVNQKMKSHKLSSSKTQSRKRTKPETPNISEFTKKARQEMQERQKKAIMNPASTVSGWRQKTTLNNDNDNDMDADVELPNTQEVFNLGLPLLTATTPISKKRLAKTGERDGRSSSSSVIESRSSSSTVEESLHNQFEQHKNKHEQLDKKQHGEEKSREHGTKSVTSEQDKSSSQNNIKTAADSDTLKGQPSKDSHGKSGKEKEKRSSHEREQSRKMAKDSGECHRQWDAKHKKRADKDAKESSSKEDYRLKSKKDPQLKRARSSSIDSTASSTGSDHNSSRPSGEEKKSAPRKSHVKRTNIFDQLGSELCSSTSSDGNSSDSLLPASRDAECSRKTGHGKDSGARPVSGEKKHSDRTKSEASHTDRKHSVKRRSESDSVDKHHGDSKKSGGSADRKQSDTLKLSSGDRNTSESSVKLHGDRTKSRSSDTQDTDSGKSGSVDGHGRDRKRSTSSETQHTDRGKSVSTNKKHSESSKCESDKKHVSHSTKPGDKTHSSSSKLESTGSKHSDKPRSVKDSVKSKSGETKHSESQLKESEQKREDSRSGSKHRTSSSSSTTEEKSYHKQKDSHASASPSLKEKKAQASSSEGAVNIIEKPAHSEKPGGKGQSAMRSLPSPVSSRERQRSGSSEKQTSSHEGSVWKAGPSLSQKSGAPAQGHSSQTRHEVSSTASNMSHSVPMRPPTPPLKSGMHAVKPGDHAQQKPPSSSSSSSLSSLSSSSSTSSSNLQTESCVTKPRNVKESQNKPKTVRFNLEPQTAGSGRAAAPPGRTLPPRTLPKEILAQKNPAVQSTFTRFEGNPMLKRPPPLQEQQQQQRQRIQQFVFKPLVVENQRGAQPSRAGENVPPGSGSLLKADDLMIYLLRWSPHWLQEYEKQLEKVGDSRPAPDLIPPVVDSSQMYPLLTTYGNKIEEYQQICFKLLLLETWEDIFRSWKEKRQKAPCQVFLTRTTPPQVVFSLHCTGLLTGQELRICHHPIEGDLVTIHMVGHSLATNGQQPSQGSHGNSKEVKSSALAFVERIKITKCFDIKQLGSTHPKLKNHPTLQKKDKDLYIFTIDLKLRYRKFAPTNKDLITITPIGSLTPAQRRFHALQMLPRCPLMRDVLSPSKEATHHVNIPAALLGRTRVNKEQGEAIATVLDALVQQVNVNKICLLRGPPGTGKSHVILTLILRIIQKKPDGKICLAAPSNAAADELLRRLLKHKQEHKLDFSVVRTGNSDNTHADVRDCVLENKVKKAKEEALHKKKMQSVPETVRTEFERLEKKLAELSEKMSALRREKKFGQADSLEKEIRKKRKEIEVLAAQIEKGKMNIILTPAEHAAIYAQELKSAHIVCGTLSSFGHPQIIRTLCHNLADNRRNNHHFTCAIIDEATQATELDSLIPLQYGMTKLFLVGDPNQLPPTVLSTKAQSLNYGLSMFERLYNHFEDGDHNPVMMLRTQYRMDPAICQFPSVHVYDGMLKTDEKVKEACSKFPLNPYVVFNIEEGQELLSQSGTLSNDMEADCTAILCEQLINSRLRIVTANIGIICPYAGQKRLVYRKLAERRIQGIEVNTVDSFQGREKHIIILSCVRARSSTGTIGFVADKRRMNVALTRAKYALYIIGHAQSLQADRDWKSLIRDAQSKDRQVMHTVQSLEEFPEMM